MNSQDVFASVRVEIEAYGAADPSHDLVERSWGQSFTFYIRPAVGGDAETQDCSIQV